MVVPYVYNQIDDQIRQQVELRFSEAYPHFAVSVRAAQCIDNEGIEIRGLSIRHREQTGLLSEVAYFDEIFLACPTDLDVLISGKIPISHIVVRRPIIRSSRDANGTWNAAKLLPLPKLGDSSPNSIVIEGGALELHDLHNPKTAPLTFRDAHFVLSPDQQLEDSQKAIRVRGSVAGNLLERLTIHDGIFDPDSLKFWLEGNLENLTVSPELTEFLPQVAKDKLSIAGSLRAQVNASFQVASPAQPDTPVQFDLQGTVVAGKVHDERLPYPLTDLHAQVSANNQGITIHQLRAHSGRATLELKCQTWGYHPQSPILLEAHANKVVLDRAWYEILPPNSALRDYWNKFSPEGEFNASVRLQFDGQRWIPDIKLKCTSGSFVHYKFPYRVDHVSGTLTLREDLLEIPEFTGIAGGRAIHLSAYVLNPGKDFTGWLQIRGDNVSLDHQLHEAINASPGKHVEIIRSLNLSGIFDFNLLISRKTPNQTLIDQALTLRLKRCSLRYDKFPYPVRNIQGLVTVNNGLWKFENLRGDNGSGIIKCNGSLTPGTQGNLLSMQFVASSIPLEDELKNALPKNSHRVWEDLRPRGTIDLEADVTYNSATRGKPEVVVRASPALARQPSDVSIEPTYFPVRLDQIQASSGQGVQKNWAFLYRDGYVQFQKLTAKHANIRIAASGYCEFGQDGRWHLGLFDLAADGIKREDNRTLIYALPSALQKTVADLRPSGPISLSNGNINLRRGSLTDDPVTSDWNLDLQMQQGELNCGIQLKNIFGGIHLEGSHNGQNMICYGELDIDSLTFRDFQLTSIRGPFYSDGSRVLLGAWPETNNLTSTPARRLQAKAYGGTIEADCAATVGFENHYQLRADLSGGSLQRFAGEAIPGPQNLQGNLSASVQLTGSGSNLHNLKGEGQIHIADAVVYDLPVMLSLLKLWSARVPDSNAFTEGDLKFRIAGQELLFDQINFEGDAFCLTGYGKMDFETRLQLELHALGARNHLRIPMVKNLVGEASQRLMKVHVQGTLADPKASSEAFPDINQALQAFQGGDASSPAPGARLGRLVRP